MKKISDNNFMQVGRTIACGHCDQKKYGEGLKQAEKAIPDYKCDCICHDNKNQTPDDRFDEKFSICSDANTKKEKKWVGIGWLRSVGTQHKDSSGHIHAIGSLIESDRIKQFLHSEIDLARSEMVEPGAVIRKIDEVRNEALEQAAKAVENKKMENMEHGKKCPTKYYDICNCDAEMKWEEALTSAADIIRKLKNK